MKDTLMPLVDNINHCYTKCHEGVTCIDCSKQVQRDADLAVLEAEKKKWAKEEAEKLQLIIRDALKDYTPGDICNQKTAEEVLEDIVLPALGNFVSELRKQAGE